MPFKLSTLALLLSGLAAAQPNAKKTAAPLHAESPSTFTSTSESDGAQVFEIRNVSFEVSNSQVPGRPHDERLLLRNTTRSRQVVGDIGQEASVTLDAWPLGQDLRQKPVYTLTVAGTGGHTVDNELFLVSRGLEEVQWWSAYKLGSGQHLFDTYVPMISFSISRDTVTTRYVGLDVPEDDSKDARLKQPNVVAVLTYASSGRVIREALVTADDPKKAAMLRSFADATRTVSLVEDAGQPSRTLKLYITQDYPSPPNPVELRIPVRNDDLDLAHAQLPPGLHVAAWRR